MEEDTEQWQCSSSSEIDAIFTSAPPFFFCVLWVTKQLLCYTVPPTVSEGFKSENVTIRIQSDRYCASLRIISLLRMRITCQSVGVSISHNPFYTWLTEMCSAREGRKKEKDTGFFSFFAPFSVSLNEFKQCGELKCAPVNRSWHNWHNQLIFLSLQWQGSPWPQLSQHVLMPWTVLCYRDIFLVSQFFSDYVSYEWLCVWTKKAVRILEDL